MPRFLYLMRHAQSADKQPGQADNERELTPQGMRDALSIGGYLYDQKINLDLILSSTAIRAKHTAERVIDAAGLHPDKLQSDVELYTASVRTFLELIKQTDDLYITLMCVGHNPVISYLAEYLTKAEIGDMPPAGTAVIKFNVNHWKEMDQGYGELIALVTPENFKS
jgi:phosphohistidine phosphatase